MTTREESGVKALTDWYADEPWRHRQDVKRVLAAADAHDLAHGVHRIVLDDATVERAARAVNSQFTLQWEKLPEWVREDERRIVRSVLAAAVQEEQP